MSTCWPIADYDDAKVFDRALVSYLGDTSWSVLSFGTRQQPIPYGCEALLDGAVGWFTSSAEVMGAIEGADWNRLTSGLKLYGRLLLHIEDVCSEELSVIGKFLEANRFQIIGVVRSQQICLISTEYYGSQSSQTRRDFHLGYYKMSRFKCYQQMQLALLQNNLEGFAVEAGDSNHVIRHMCNDLKTTYSQASYPENDIQRLRHFGSNTADVFICDNTLEHVPDPIRAVREIHRVLRRRGVGIFMTPFIAQCQRDDYFRFSRLALEVILKRFNAVRIGSWGNREAGCSYIERDKWVSVDYEREGLLYCHDRNDPVAGPIVLSSTNDDKYPVHYYAIVMK
jgi:SAM-dependent methyltransferase